MKYNAICFDLDGVIINSEPIHEASFADTLNDYNVSLSHDEYLQYFAGKSDLLGFENYLQTLQIKIPPLPWPSLPGQALKR